MADMECLGTYSEMRGIPKTSESNGCLCISIRCQIKCTDRDTPKEQDPRLGWLMDVDGDPFLRSKYYIRHVNKTNDQAP